MHPRFNLFHWSSVALAVAWATALTGCESNSATAAGNTAQGGKAQCEVGAERCACYKNDTCDAGLSCLSDLCVQGKNSSDPDTSGGSGGTVGVTGSGTNNVGTTAAVGIGGNSAGTIAAAGSGTNNVGTTAVVGTGGNNVGTTAATGTVAAAGTGSTGSSSNPSGSGGATAVSSSTTPVLADGTVGSSCGTCAAGFTCVSDVPGGYCTKICASNAECGTAGACIQTTSGAACFRACKSNAECRSGYACVSAGTVSVCDVAASTDPGTTGGTCANSCLHYFECKGVFDAVTYQNCITNCSASAYSADFLAAFQATDCATAIQLIEGPSSSGSGTGTGTSSECSGCTWDGSSCVYLSQYTLVSTAGITCKSSCC